MRLKGVLKPWLQGPVEHAGRLLRDADYRAYARLLARYHGLPQETEVRTRACGMRMAAPDASTFLSAFRAVFVERAYAFECRDAQPSIADLGAHVGLGTLWLKRRFPGARVTAFEADPAIYAYLEENVRRNGLSGVETVHAAVWTANGQVRFDARGGDAGRVKPERSGAAGLAVPAVDIAGWLGQRQFDFVKMDIEGAEAEVLPACRGALGGVRRLFVEYHSPSAGRQRLPELLGLLQAAGFRLHVRPEFASEQPFVRIESRQGFDMQVNIYAWREDG